MTETSDHQENTGPAGSERACAYRVLRYTPNLVRDEWVNIGVLVFDPQTGERRLRIIEEEDEFRRVRRLHPGADELLLRAIRDDLEDRFQSESASGSNGNTTDWQKLLAKWDATLSNALQLAPQKGVFASDLDAELERLYGDHVAPQRAASRVGAPVSRAPADAKLFAYTAERITAKASLKTEFAAVTDVALNAGNDRHRFVRDTLRDAGIEPIPMEGFAVWVAKLKPLLQ